MLSSLESDRRRLIPRSSSSSSEQNAAGEAVARAKKEGHDASAILAGNKARGRARSDLEADLLAVEQQRDALLLTLPNLPHESVPVGSRRPTTSKCAAGARRRRSTSRRSRTGISAPALGILDFERATRMSGARFSVLMGAGARLERALINFMLDLHTREHGYTRGGAAVPREHGVAHAAPAICRSSSRTCSRSPATGICI